MVPRPKRHHQVLVSPCDSIVLCWLPGLPPHWKKLYWWCFVEGCRQRVEVQEKADRKNGEYPSLSTGEFWFLEPLVSQTQDCNHTKLPFTTKHSDCNFTPNFSNLLIVKIETNLFFHTWFKKSGFHPSCICFYSISSCPKEFLILIMLPKGDYKVWTVKVRFMDTRLTWTPHYYGQFAFSPGL